MGPFHETFRHHYAGPTLIREPPSHTFSTFLFKTAAVSFSNCADKLASRFHVHIGASNTPWFITRTSNSDNSLIIDASECPTLDTRITHNQRPRQT